MIAGTVKDSCDANAVRHGTEIDHVTAEGETAALPAAELRSEFAHLRLRRQHLACRNDRIDERIGALAASALPSNVQTDVRQVVARHRRNFEARHPMHQLVSRLKPGVDHRLDRFAVKWNAFAAIKLFDSLVHVADKLFAMPQEFNGPVEGLAPVVVDAERDDTLDELLVFG
jgi:hypothetical protein